MTKRKLSKNKERRMTRIELAEKLTALQSRSKAGDRRIRDSELRAVLHELEVSQIELEVQNRALVESRRAVDEAYDRYLNLYDFAPIGYVTLDSRGIICEMNLTAAELLGVNRHQILNRSIAPKILKEDLPKFRQHLLACRNGDRKVSPDITMIGPQKKEIPVQLLSSCTIDSSTGRLLMRTAMTDLTEQKRVENERQELVRQLESEKLGAEKANEIKSAFLANMSHEIRTPLAAILGFTELIKDSNCPVERARLGKIVSRNGLALTRLIDDILDLSKVESGRLELERIEFSLKNLVDEITGLFVESARSKKVGLIVDFDSRTPAMISSDPTRLRQILINLIGNAMKFTSVGSVTVEVRAVFERDVIVGVQFKVKDTGIGMSEDQATRLFETFTQADNSTTRKFGGSGLGLVLSRKLARALGGDVIIEKCEPGVGCTFVASVGAGPALQKHHLNHPIYSDTKVHRAGASKVLLVEDSPDNQMLVCLVLGRAGMKVDVANNGAEGVQMAEANNYDVVLMDMQMPVLDGYAATEQLRLDGYRKPIVALTAHAMVEDRNRILASGCDAHLTKPLDSKLLIETIDQMMN